MQIKDKVIVITGASAGIGRAAAENLATKGAKLVLAARSKDKIEALAASLPDAIAVQADIRKPEDVQHVLEQAVQKYGRINILINNAGQGIYGAVETVDLAQYKDIMELNVFGLLTAMQRVIPIMRHQGGGMILNISSRVSKNYFPYLGAYASTKYAVNALSLTARQELEKDHIIVSVFHPKMTATQFGENAVGQRPAWSANSSGPRPDVDTPEQVAEKIAEQIISEEPEAMM